MAGTQLESEGWVVLRFWEHEVKADLPKVTEIVFRAVNRSKERSGEPVQAR
jgi:very-short-patch-repair endonuclease